MTAAAIVEGVPLEALRPVVVMAWIAVAVVSGRLVAANYPSGIGRLGVVHETVLDKDGIAIGVRVDPAAGQSSPPEVRNELVDELLEELERRRARERARAARLPQPAEPTVDVLDRPADPRKPAAGGRDPDRPPFGYGLARHAPDFIWNWWYGRVLGREAGRSR